MTVIMFQHRFAPKVADGIKLQTIRRERKKPILIGEFLLLRKWKDKAYRSKTEDLATGICISYRPIIIEAINLIRIPAQSMMESDLWIGSDTARNDFAKADGFDDWADMRTWFEAEHSLPFTGVLIKWRIP
jgi:hypothetical protein